MPFFQGPRAFEPGFFLDTPVATSMSDDVADFRPVSRLRVQFETPTLIEVQKRPVRKPEFSVPVKTALRRFELLTGVHGAGRLDIDFRGMVERSREVRIAETRLKWEGWKRCSTGQDRTTPCEGLVGTVDYGGPLIEFLPLLQVAERIHVGKHAAFGQRRVAIEPLAA